MLSHLFIAVYMGMGVKWGRLATALHIQVHEGPQRPERGALHHIGLAPSGTGIRSMPIYGRNTSGSNIEPSAC